MKWIPDMALLRTNIVALGNYIRMEPAVVSYALTAAAVLFSAYVVHVTKTQEAAITTIAASGAALATAALARPARVPVMVGSVVAGLAAAAAFGLRVPPETLAAITTGGTVVLSLLFRVHLTPRASGPAHGKLPGYHAPPVPQH